MGLVSDIAATYRRPGRVMRRLLAMGHREDRALIFLMISCVVVFVGQWPRLAREAHLTGQELNPLLGGALLGWLFIMPLVLYALAFVVGLLMRVIRQEITGFGARLALFWAFLASSPLLLIYGLVAGFIGPGPQLFLVGAFWLSAFLWFWGSGLIAARKAMS